MSSCTTSSPAPPASSARTSSQALNRAAITTSSPSTTCAQRRQVQRTSPTARSPTTSTRRDFLRARAGHASTARSRRCCTRAPAPTRWRRDGRYMMENNYRYSLRAARLVPGRGGAAALRLVGLGVRRRARVPRGARARAAAQRLRLLQVPVRPGRAPAAAADAPRRSSGLRYFNVYGPNEAHKGRMASVAFHFFNQYRGRGQREAVRRQRTATATASSGAISSTSTTWSHVNLYFLEQPRGLGRLQLRHRPRAELQRLAAAVINAVRRHAAPRCTTLRARSGLIEYIPFPPQLVGKYQSFTQADLTRLRAAGYPGEFLTVERAWPPTSESCSGQR